MTDALLVTGARPGPVTLRDNCVIGDGGLTFMAGPCAVESEEQALRIAHAVAARGATVYRGGVFKPRTSPYAFQGLGLPGLAILKRVAAETGLAICTEATDVASLGAVAEVADIVQIGSRSMDNTALLKAAGGCGRPVLLKRGMVATIDELLLAAEYVMASGNDSVILCERGLRVTSGSGRNLLDLQAVLRLKAATRLPVIVDPSHAAGLCDDVAPLACAAAAVGCDGLLVEVHDRPDEALCDGPQALAPDAFGDMVSRCQRIHLEACPGRSSGGMEEA